MIKRQKYHLEPDRGLLNDPNGLVFYKDMYHVFFQWNRFEKNHSYKEWGHFTSKDLLHWNWERVLFCRTSFMSKMEFTQGVH